MTELHDGHEAGPRPRLTPQQAAHDSRGSVVAVPAGFMSDGATYKRGAELGFDGADFYIAGRGGALGDVRADVVTAAMVFFAPDRVRDAWARTETVMSRSDAACAWSEAGHAWAQHHLADGPDYRRLAALLGRVITSADVAAAPLFAGWRTLPEPDAPKALAQHRLNAVRELRGGLHGAAVITVGLAPLEAVAVRSPAMAAVMGWQEPLPDDAKGRDRWQLAEARTDRMLGKAFAVLDQSELRELVDLCGEVHAAVS